MSDRAALIISDTVKCQACVHCRMRKLRCIKKPAGCLRCTAEGLDCVYLLRRAMGRPKSRVQSEQGQSDGAQAQLLDRDRDSNLRPQPKHPVGSALHIMRLGSPPRAIPRTFRPDGGQVPTNFQAGEQPFWTQFGIGAVGLLDSISFGGQDSPQQSLLPQSLSKTSSPVNPRGESVPLGSAAPFCCTERLIGCVDALSTMPNDFWGALQTTRQSSRTVYEVFECPQCGAAFRRASKLLQDSHSMDAVLSDPYPIIIILGTMFPLISNAYARVAELVKNEDITAMNGGGQIMFDLGTCGGLWGPLGENGMKCQEYYSNLAMDAESWRTTVRALLRADIHGFDIQRRNDKGDSYHYHQPGLWDLIEGIKGVLDRLTTDHLEQESANGPSTELQFDTELISQVMEASQQLLNRLALT